MGKPRWLDASETIKQRILRDAVVDLANRLGITPESVASSACPRESEVDEPGPHVAPAPPPDEEAALVAGAVEGELHACDNPRDPADDIA